MPRKGKSALVNHRARMERRGFVRVEVNVKREDASLLRRVAAALSDPTQTNEARRMLKLQFLEPAHVNLKELLAMAPLEEINLDRPRDLGRTSEL